MKRLSVIKEYRDLPIQVKASLWFVASTVLIKGISFITVPIFTRIMTTEQYGVYSIYLTWYEMLTVIGTLSLESCAYMSVLTKFDETRRIEAQTSLLELPIVITSVLMAVCLLFGDEISSIVGIPKIMIVLMLLQIYFVPAVNYWSVKSRFEYKYKLLVFVSLSMALFNSLLGIIFVLNIRSDYQAYGRVLSIVGVQIVYGSVFLYSLNKGQKFEFTSKYWRWAIKLHLPLLPHIMSLKILGSADRIMINSMIGSTAAAKYSIAFSIAFVINLLKTSIIDAARPWMYQKLQKNEAADMQKVLSGILLFVALLTITFVAFAPEIMYIVAPPDYHEAIYCMPPVIVSSFFTFLYTVFSIVEMYYEKTKKIMAASIGAAALNIILNYALIPVFGYIAAAFTTLVCYIALAMFHYCMAKITLKENHVEEKLFDSKMVIGLSGAVIGLVLLFESLYTATVLRYGFLLLMMVFAFLKRKYFIDLFKTIKQK